MTRAVPAAAAPLLAAAGLLVAAGTAVAVLDAPVVARTVTASSVIAEHRIQLCGTAWCPRTQYLAVLDDTPGADPVELPGPAPAGRQVTLISAGPPAVSPAAGAAGTALLLTAALAAARARRH